MFLDSTDSIDELDSRSDLTTLEDLYNRYWEVIEERSIAYADDPVGKTGLYTRALKIGGTRDRPAVVEEYVPDHQLIAGLRKTMKHIAIRKGQWKQSKESVEEAQNLREKWIRLKEGMARAAESRAERAAEEAAKKETQPEESA